MAIDMEQPRGQLRRKLIDMHRKTATKTVEYPWYEGVCGYNNYDDDGGIAILIHESRNISRTLFLSREELRMLIEDYEIGQRGDEVKP